MEQHIRTARSNFGVVHILLNRQRWNLDPLTILEITAVLSDFANINFRIKIGSKRFAVIAVIAIHNIQGIHAIEVMFLRISGVYVGHAWVKART